MTATPHETRWSLVVRAKGESPEARAALSELCEIYYLPVHRFIARWAGEQEAEDLTHEFFARILETNRLANANPERGKFRNYLYGAVKHFLANSRAKVSASKRGGGREHVSCEDIPLESPPADRPDLEFDRAWACALLSRAVSMLADEMEAKGKKETFEQLRPWLAGLNAHGDQLAVAGELGVSETAIRVIVHRMRMRLREIVESEVTQTLEPGANVANEIRHLLGAC